METKAYNACGRVVYWSLNGESNWGKLQEGCLAAGLPVSTLPDERTPLSALRHGIDHWVERTGRKSVLVRPLSQTDGYSVVYEHVGDDRNVYDCVAGLKINRHQRAELPRVVTGEIDELDVITVAYREALNRSSQEAVAGYLCRVVFRLGGTCLRPNGGIYWLPESALERFGKVVESVESAGTHGVFLLAVANDAQLVRSVGDAITAEVALEAEAIETDLAGGDLGDKAIKTRLSRARALLAKVREYEAALQITLSPLVERMEQVETQCAVLQIQDCVAEETQ